MLNLIRLKVNNILDKYLGIMLLTTLTLIIIYIVTMLLHHIL